MTGSPTPATSESPIGNTLNSRSVTVYDWTADQWTIPVSLQANQILLLGGLPLSVGLGGRYFAEAPSGGPQWGIRFQVTLLFPR